MRYIGGKSKIAKRLSQAILERTDCRAVYYEPFMGGGAVSEHMAPAFLRSELSDASGDLMMMWFALCRGWVPPQSVTEAEYSLLRDSEPSPLRGLVGFGGSFGGKWFGGYARGNKKDGTPRNYLDESARNAMRIAESLVGSTLLARSYVDLVPVPGSVIYCDPPYAATEGYSAVGGFDSGTFWAKAAEWAASGCDVFVSEYAAPDGWECVWESSHRLSLTLASQGRPATTERLFMKEHP